MPLKNTVASERRMDLASLFCMIGRHGPAVALAVFAVVSVLAGIYIYRNVRRKRRKVVADEGVVSAAEEDRDASVIQRLRHSSGESTDVSDDDSSDKMGDVDTTESELRIRHRPSAAAAAETKPCYSPLKVQTPESKTYRTTEEEVSQDLSSNISAVAEELLEADSCVNESRLREPELVNEEPDEVPKAECLEDEDVSPNGKTKPEEQDLPAPCICSNKDEKFEVNPDSSGDRNYSRNHLSPEEEKESDSELAAGESRDVLIVAAQAGILRADLPFEVETVILLTSDVTEEVVHEILLNKTAADRLETAQFDQEEEDNGLTCGQEEVLTSDDTVPSSEEHDNSSVSAHVEAENHDLSGVTTAKAKGTDSPLVKMPPDPEIPSDDAENLCEHHRNKVVDEEYADHQSVHVVDDNIPDKVIIAIDVVVENVTVSVTAEQPSHPPPPSVNQTETTVNSATCKAAHPEMCSSQDQESHMEEELSAAVAAPNDISLLVCQIYSPSFEQREQKEDDLSSAAVGEESGISSLAVSPDLQDDGTEFGMNVGASMQPALDFDPQTAAQNKLYADDAVLSVKDETTDVTFRSYTSSHSQTFHSEHIHWTHYETLAANEDTFGHEIEDSYHKVMDEFASEIALSVTSFTSDLNALTDIKTSVTSVEVVEIKEKTSVRAENKDESAEEKEVEYERTEISIMEATMDNNEWITDSNYQVLPWMKINQHPFDGCCTATVTTGSEIPPSSEVRQTSGLSLADENMENNKKVVAVQPMPQNVNVTFCVHYHSKSAYQTVAVTGNQPELGNWKEFIPLEKAKDGHWITVVSLPVESHVEWKFVLLDKGEVSRWEECGNHLLDTGCGDDLLVHKWWGHI